MIKESNTIHSEEINQNILRLFLDYPMGTYIPAWKMFRAFTNENKVIADQIATCSVWNGTNDANVLDIGTGDGLVIKEVLRLVPSINSLNILEPNPLLLEEAEKNLETVQHPANIYSINSDINSVLRSVFTGIDITIIAHVLYLLPNVEFEQILAHLPLNLPLIIITDAEDSLFPNCWELTANKYFIRSQSIHSYLNSLDKNKYIISNKRFDTLLKNPLTIENDEIKQQILSMITYSDYETLDLGTQQRIQAIVNKFSVNDITCCQSICYQIIKK